MSIWEKIWIFARKNNQGVEIHDTHTQQGVKKILEVLTSILGEKEDCLGCDCETQLQ